jgi:ribose 5-phosphate isomerase B
MRLAIGSDERTHLTDQVVQRLLNENHDLILFGPLANSKSAWPEVARLVGEAVVSGDADEGILFCWTGTGVSIAANKIPGIRAALCDDAETARGARLWNNANVLCLSLRRISDVLAEEILESWFATKYEPNPADDACLSQIDQLESTHTSTKRAPKRT